MKLLQIALCALLATSPALAQEPQRIRGLLTQVDANTATVRTTDGRTLRLTLSAQTTIFGLSKASYTEIDFGVYVGSVSERMGDDIYSPIVRDSLSWLHRGLELRIIDEKLRGIAVGHTKWDLTRESVMTHGWVDDQEDRVISIKFGPTEQEETDVEISPQTPVYRMFIGDRALLRPGAGVVVGVQKGAALFIFVGKDGVVPAL